MSVPGSWPRAAPLSYWCVPPAGSAKCRAWSGSGGCGKSDFPPTEAFGVLLPRQPLSGPQAGRRRAAGTGRDRTGQSAALLQTRLSQRPAAGAARHRPSQPAPGLGETGWGWAPRDFVTGPGEGSAGPSRPGTCGEERPPTLPRGRRSPPPAGGRTNSPRRIVRLRTTLGRSRPAAGAAAQRRGGGRAGTVTVTVTVTVTPVPRGSGTRAAPGAGCARRARGSAAGLSQPEGPLAGQLPPASVPPPAPGSVPGPVLLRGVGPGGTITDGAFPPRFLLSDALFFFFNLLPPDNFCRNSS